jgi:L-malate glycosyltransferase
MRILHIIQKKQYRGAEIFACQLSNHLIDLGHNVKVVSIYNGRAKLPFREDIINLSNEESNRYLDFAGWKKLNKIILNFNPDIVQANAADTLKYAVFSKFFYKWKQPVIFRNASTSSYYIKSFFSKILNTFLLKHVDHIISVSAASRSDLNTLFPFTKNNTSVIPVGIETCKDIHCSLGINRYNIIHVGSFTHEKNHEGLLFIFQEVKKKINTSHLHLFGDGPLRKKIEKEVVLLGLEKAVTFYDEVDNPLPYISNADILVLPSLIEGLPAVILEAMSCKTPVIAFDVGGISEILNDQTGYLIPKGDNNSFFRSILEVYSNNKNLKVETAYNLVTTNYLNYQITSLFVDIYYELLHSSK